MSPSTLQPGHTHPHTGRHRALIVALTAGSLLSAGLYLHDINWWYAPLGIVLLHLVPLLLVAAAAALLIGRRAPDGSAIVRTPRLYDWFVGLLSLGRERRMRRRTLGFAALKPGDRVLDVGCGTGSLLCEAAELVGAAGELHGIDAGEAMLARARAKAEARGTALRLREGSAAQLPYADDGFDAAFCTLVLHHLERAAQPAALEEMRRVVRPGGRIVVVEMQRPASRGGRLRSLVSLIAWLHGTPPEGDAAIVDVASELRSLGCEAETVAQRGPLATIVATVPEGA